MEKPVFINQPRVFAVFSSLRVKRYNSDSFYFDEDGLSYQKLTTHPKAHVFILESYSDDVESVRYSAVIFTGPEICFSKTATFLDNMTTVEVISEKELTEEHKAVISASYSKSEYPVQFVYQIGALSQDIESLTFDPDADNYLEANLSKEWVNQIIQKIKEEEGE